MIPALRPEQGLSSGKKESLADDILELVALLPWWIGIALAVLSYFVLHSLAKPDPVVAMSINQVGAFAVRGMWKAAASIFQYLIPLLCIGGAFASFWRRRQRKSLVDNVAQAKSTNALDAMS